MIDECSSYKTCYPANEVDLIPNLRIAHSFNLPDPSNSAQKAVINYSQAASIFKKYTPGPATLQLSSILCSSYGVEAM